MKGIIAEQQESKQGCSTNTDNVMVAEKSILVEEDQDLTQFTQNIDVDNNVIPPKNVMEVIDISDDDEDVRKLLNFNEKEVIYLCNEENDTTNIKENDFNCNENLQRAISKLTIEDEDSTSILNLGPDCSQSILDKYTYSSNIDDNKRSDANKNIFSQDLDKIIRSHTISREYDNSIPAKNDTSITTVKTQAKSQHPNSNIKSTESLKGSDSISQSNKKNTKTITKEKPRRQKTPNKTKKSKKDSKENKKKTSVKRNKQNKIETETMIDLATGTKTNPILKIDDIAKEQNVPVEVTKSFNSYERACAQVQDYSKDTVESPISRALYSINVENDLSWIENIRYVREVRQDENISICLDDSFWDNYTLPKDWNDDDFLYS